MAARVDKSPAKLNYKYKRGDTVAEPITIKEGGEVADLSDRTYAAQLRKAADAEVFVQMTVDETDKAEGTIVLRLEHEETIELSGRYVWDLEQTRGNVVRTLLGGDFLFDPDVTRAEPEP